MHEKSQSYNVQFLGHGLRQTEIFVILGYFLPFYPTNNPQNQNFEKVNKAPWYIIGFD